MRPIAAGGLALAAAGLSAAAWATLVEPRWLEVTRHEVELPNLPPTWDGRLVGFISDLQIGVPGANVGTIRRAVDRLIEVRAALALLGGDFLYYPDRPGRQAERVARLVRPLVEAGVPTFAVLGNHDYAEPEPERRDGPDPWARSTRDALEAVGVRVLDNEAAAVGGPDAPLYVVGIASQWAEAPAGALAGVPAEAARVVLLHNPGSFADLPTGSAPLAVAGHTHGGQVRPPGLGGIYWHTQKAPTEPWRSQGWVDGYGRPGNRLYVNRGIGFSSLPVRFRCRPELTLFALCPTYVGAKGGSNSAISAASGG
jgi:predicted MPP superfamily phosphohydrolase